MNSWAYNLVEHLEKFIDFGLPLLMLLAAPILIHVGVRSFKKPPGPACPKCKYDMRSIQTLSCPECGHTVKTAEELSRPKCRWVLLTLGVLMLLFSLSAGVLMVSTMLEARRAERIVAQVRTIDPYCRTEAVRNTQPPPNWAMWIASFVAGEDPAYDWINPNQQYFITTSSGVQALRDLLAISVLDYCCQPTWAYYKYWPVEVVTELSIDYIPDQSVLEIIGLCKDLERLVFRTIPLTTLKSEDYAVFEPMHRLKVVEIVNDSALPKGALKSIFKNKPNLEHVEISIHSHADEALIEIGAGSPHVKIMKLHDDDGLDTDYPDDMTPSPPSGITSAGLAALSGCTQMEELEAWLTDLKPDDLNFLAFMKNLRVLKVHISNTHQITAANFDAIGRATSLRDLTFSFRSPAGQKPQGLLRGLSGLTNLEKLSLHLYRRDENDFEFLKSMTSLHNLHLSSYGGDGSGLRIIENHPSLKTLTLERPWKLKPEHEAFLKNLKNVNVTIKR